MKNRNKSIYIAILNQGDIRPENAALMMKLVDQRKYNVFISYPANKPITHNRNTIVKRFLETDFDYLLMMDNDCVPPDNILELADYQKDVIGGLCFGWMKNMIIPFALVKNKEQTYDIVESVQDGGVVECDGIGSGVMMIKREVLENMPFPFKNEYDPEGIKTKGLDIRFCERAKEKGHKVFCDVSMPCSHWATIDLKVGYQTYTELKNEILRIKNDNTTIQTTKKDN